VTNTLLRRIEEAIARATRAPGIRTPVLADDEQIIGYIMVPNALPPQECCVESRRDERLAIARLAREIGDEFVENGKRLQEMLPYSAEGRLRELAGGLFSNLAECLWIDDRFYDDKRRIEILEVAICKVIGSEALDRAVADAKREVEDGGSP
jgi:hypothetical protein